MRCFARRGFEATSMADIVAEANSSAGSLYSNFTSKADLIRFAAASALTSLVEHIEAELPKQRTPARVLRHLLQPSTDPVRARTQIQIWAAAPRDPELAAIAREKVADLRAVIQDAIGPWADDRHRDTGTPRRPMTDSMTEAMILAIQGFVVAMTLDGDRDADTLIHDVLSNFPDE